MKCDGLILLLQHIHRYGIATFVSFFFMNLEQLSILNYKNIAEASLAFSPNVNCFIGDNGMGKTNILDAIYYLSFCKSNSQLPDQMAMRHDTDVMMIQGRYRNSVGEEDVVTCGLKRGQRKHFKRNDKEYKRLSEHLGLIPLVMISPADSELITGGSEERRRFLDIVISQTNLPYLEALIRYGKSLQQRNVLLKQEDEPDWGLCEVLEMMMAEDAEVIYATRAAMVEAYRPIFQELYGRLCNNTHEEVSLSLESHGERGNLLPILQTWRERERIVGHTLHGPHKDNLELTLNGYNIRKEGSQGQTKTYFIAMKLAQFLYLKTCGRCQTPILLLDDIFDKLDSGRVARIVDYVSRNDFGQIFITDTNREHLDSILQQTLRDYRLFNVSHGNITEIPHKQ